MADYLPDMIDPETEEENPNINAESIEEEIKDIKESEDAFAGDEDIIKEEIEEELKREEEEAEIPIVEARKKLSQDEVFKPPKVKPVAPLTEEEKPKKIKKKRVMSEKQLENLKKAREKAMENKRKRKEAKAKGTTADVPPTPKQVKAKQIRAEKKQDKMDDDDIERIANKAVEKYDTMRKARKAEKKAKQAETVHKEKVKKQILSAQGKVDQDDIWSQALGGMMM